MLLFLSFGLLLLNVAIVQGSAGGGVECAACTIISGLLEQKIALDSSSIEKELDTLCGKLPAGLKVFCETLVNLYGKAIIEGFNNHETPDKICHDYVKVCTIPTCTLFPQHPTSDDAGSRKRSVHGVERVNIEWPWQWLANRIGKNHLPIFDTDNDYFSTVEALRGSHFRGRDCDDGDATIYPGRSSSKHPASVDHNCNGIYELNGVDYEEKLCGGTDPIGVGVLGDSASAHFEIPPAYLTAKDINTGTYDGALDLLANEFDWPWRSTVTGYQASSSEIPVSSIYLKVRELNQCSHRDYQNIAVNGARASTANETLVHEVARHRTLDRPMLMFLSLVGNDVCDHQHSLDHFTPVAKFHAQTLGTLKQLDENLPPGSHVMTVGLADGRVLYDALHNRTHPIGVKYPAVYDFLNCLDISPCWGWMNANATVRDATSAHAAQLSAQYQKIIDEHKFANIEVGYLSFIDIFANVTRKWESIGGKIWELIEPVDGFHPGQRGQALIAEEIWANMVKYFPSFIPKQNPNNDEITRLFGDQNGY